MLKIISPQEMNKLDKLATKTKGKEKEFVLHAGRGVFNVVHTYFPKKKKIYLLIGKGNNGADAYVCGLELLKKKYKVLAYALFDGRSTSPLNKEFEGQFKKKGGKVKLVKQIEDIVFDDDGLIIDGIFGIGFSSPMDKNIVEIINKANKSSLPIVAIDIPSGVNADTGEVIDTAIKATITVALGFYKTGFFLKDGFNHIGKLVLKNFGLPIEIMNEAKEKFLLFNPEEIRPLLPKIKRNRHKYEAGSVVGIAGSLNMDGAAKLSSLACLRAGAGIVKLFLQEELEYSSQNFPYEVIKLFWSKERILDVIEIVEKSHSVFIGPGMGRDKDVLEFFASFFTKVNKPCVIDADALYFYADSRASYPEGSIITPHKKEMARLLKMDEFSLDDCQQYVNRREVILVLKGAPTFILVKGKKPVVVPYGDPGMATAGVGDVLTGILAALIAQGLSSYDAALLGVHLHAFAGELAAFNKTSYGMIASDVIEALPNIFKTFL
jgi:NAD(P)H-hydrate epimerase